MQIVKFTEGHPDTAPLREFYFDFDPTHARRRAAVEKIAVTILKSVIEARRQGPIDELLPELDARQVSEIEPAFGVEFFTFKPRRCSVSLSIPTALEEWAPFGLPSTYPPMNWAKAEQHIPYLRAEKEIQRFNFRAEDPVSASPRPEDAGEVTGVFLVDSAHLSGAAPARNEFKRTFDEWGRRRVLVIAPNATVLDTHFTGAAAEYTIVHLGIANMDDFVRGLSDGLRAQWKTTGSSGL